MESLSLSWFVVLPMQPTFKTPYFTHQESFYMNMRLFILFTLMCICSTPSFGQSFEDAVAAYARGDYGQAFTLFEQLAEADHLDAQNNLGVLFQTGQGTVQDFSKAADWYQRAALRGHRDAQGNLAGLFAVGQGVTQDLTMAYAWYHQAAQQGDATAAQNRDEIAKRLSPPELARAQQLNVMANAPTTMPPATVTPPPIAETPPATVTPPPVAETPPATVTPPPVAETPPATVTPPPVAETPPATVTPPPIAETPTPPLPVSRPVSPRTSETVAAIPRPAPAVPTVHFDPARLSADGRFYTVGPGDTLWSIARGTRPRPDIPIATMVEAIRRANPQAFGRGGLQAGARLQIPSL